MQINAMKISNILSYKYLENFDAAPLTINFASCGKENNMHILIGPNGSGKSCLLEILNQIFKKSLFTSCYFNRELFESKATRPTDLKGVLTTEEINRNISNLSKNWNNDKSEQKLFLSITFSDNDYLNMKFIISHQREIKEIFVKYSKVQFNFPNDDDKSALFNKIKQIDRLNLYFSRADDVTKSFIVEVNDGKEMDRLYLFLKDYLLYFEYIQQAIVIYNIINLEEKWQPLRNTFSLIGCYRNYNDVAGVYSVNPKSATEQNRIKSLENKVRSSGTFTSQNNEPVEFELVKHKIAYAASNMINKQKMNADEMLVEIKKTDLCESINELLYKFIEVELVIDVHENIFEGDFYFIFKDKNKTNMPIKFSGLSAGQKGIVHLIFALYGYNIQDGMLIIDEPEIHLHPQFQKMYLDILLQESKKRNIQFIIATHSPVFITEKTIGYVKRFYFDYNESTTQIIVPKLDEADKFLVQILHYTNTAKIFFVDKVILTEGQSDTYFFEFYIESFKNSLKQQEQSKRKKNNKSCEKPFEFEKISNFTLVDIKGKKAFKDWESFLKKWKIKVYFIGDWDNVEDFKIISKDMLCKFRRGCSQYDVGRIVKKIESKDSRDGKELLRRAMDYLNTPNEQGLSALKEFVDFLKQKHISYRKLIDNIGDADKQLLDKKIEEKYDDGVFILKNGELEDYLGVDKGIDNVIKFCNQFSSEKIDEANRNELNNIIKNIFEVVDD